MKKILKVCCIVLTIMMVMQFNVHDFFAQADGKTITIVFTHDLHEHLLPTKYEENGQIKTYGGFARVKSIIDDTKKTDQAAVVVDGGDYSMGSLFQSIYSSDAPELRILGSMGYDAVTLGNHEYDFRGDGLADSLNAAGKSGDKLPQIVQSNVYFPKDENGELTPSLQNLKQAMNDYGVKDYTVIERNGIKIGIFGLMGKDAAIDAPMSEVEFTDTVENAERVVSVLREKEKVDMVICLSHTGTNKDKSKSEDEIIAKEVDGIDVIVSGHTHTTLEKPILVNNTIIGSCGKYSENVGVIKIQKGTSDNWKLKSYELKPVNDDILSDDKIDDIIEKFKNIVQSRYLDNFGMRFDEVITNSKFNFTPESKIGNKLKEDTLGNLISDSYIYAIKKAEKDKYEEVTAAIVPSGTIRGTFVKGDITAADIFNVSSLGIGRDKLAGYPLISVYLTGKELRTACEVDASISPMMPSAQLYMSGLSYKFNPNRLILNKVMNVKLQTKDGKISEIDDKKLYRVAAGLYSAQMLSAVNSKSHGILSIVPKDKNGVPVTDFESLIIKQSCNGKEIEVKEWLAISEYLKSFGNDGIPEYYNKVQKRKIIENSHKVVSLLSNPNGIAIAAYSIIIGIILLIIFIIYMIVKHRKKKKYTENKTIQMK